jgi:hypothetical protein
MTGHDVRSRYAPMITFDCVKSGEVFLLLTTPCFNISGTSLPRKPEPGISDSGEIQLSIQDLNNLFGLITPVQNFVCQSASLTKQIYFLYSISLSETEFPLFFHSKIVQGKVLTTPHSKFPSLFPLTVFV